MSGAAQAGPVQAAGTVAGARPARARSPLGTAWVALAIAWLVAMVLVAVFSEMLRPYSITAVDLTSRLKPPVLFGGIWKHPLGTDELGRDVLSRLIVSIRISLMIAFGATLLGIVIGTAAGLLSAHFRGWVEQAVMMLVDVQAAMPFLILALSVLAFFGNSLPLLIGLLGLHGWERHARIARGLALAASAQGYVVAVKQIGLPPRAIYLRHVLPNISAALIVSATLAFPDIILLESGLSFLGLGVQPPMSSLGNMVGYGRGYLSSAPWILLIPGAVIVLTTYAISVLGDWLRDVLDPTLA